jgi:hypothetical protein
LGLCTATFPSGPVIGRIDWRMLGAWFN